MIPPHLVRARDSAHRASDAARLAQEECTAAKDAWDDLHRRGVKLPPGVEGDLMLITAEQKYFRASAALTKARCISRKAHDAYTAALTLHDQARPRSARAAYRAALADAQVTYRLARLTAKNDLDNSK